MAEMASMGRSFWLSPMQYRSSRRMPSRSATRATMPPLVAPLAVSSSR